MTDTMDTRGAPFSHAADLILKEVGREEGFESRKFVRLQNLLLNEGDNHPWIIPQPYRDRFIALYNAEAAQSGSDETLFPLTPFPSGESYNEEARRLFDEAVAKNIQPIQVARQAGVTVARVMAFYRDNPLTPAIRSKIVQAHADLGV